MGFEGRPAGKSGVSCPGKLPKAAYLSAERKMSHGQQVKEQ